MTQFYKSIYFNDFPSNNSKEKSITIAFNEAEKEYYSVISKLSNEEIRELIKIESYHRLVAIAKTEDRSLNQIIKRNIKFNINSIDKINRKRVTFINSKEIPFQRWYEYIEGYSPEFVKSIISDYCPDAKLIYDPFGGTGTTIFACDELKISTIYSEINPLLQYLINTKINILKLSSEERYEINNKLNKIIIDLHSIQNYDEDKILKDNYRVLFNDSIYFGDDTFSTILKLKTFIQSITYEKGEIISDILNIAVISSLIPSSLLKKVGDLRFKTEQELIDSPPKEFIVTFITKLKNIIDDINNVYYKLNSDHELILSNAKNIDLINEIKIDAIITSPPYLNGTNYFRNTKLELWFLKFIQYENDLRYLRDQTVTSGINDVIINNFNYEKELNKLNSKLLKDTIAELNKVTYDKRIPIMAIEYFKDMNEFFNKLKGRLNTNAKIIIDIGDSIFSGIHIQTENILIEILNSNGYKFKEKKLLRKRRSKNGAILTQNLIIFENINKSIMKISNKDNMKLSIKWNKFKNDLPHQKQPYSKRNWGNQNHSLCSYQGKLKPSIAHFLIDTFVPENGYIFDPFSGVGTIPFEAALNGKFAYGMDLSPLAYYISSAKVSNISHDECFKTIRKINAFINDNKVSKTELNETKNFGFNKTLSEYYDVTTLNEIILARKYFHKFPPSSPAQMLVISSLLHILHGNRPYALSRNSHPIIPYAPTGEYIYKSLIDNLNDKVQKSLNEKTPPNFVEGKIFLHDSTKIWPHEINNIDTIVTSPPFFDSTRFYLANWIRIWFAGWNEQDFKYKTSLFVEEKQKQDFNVYTNIFRQARERLKKDGLFVLHLGKSNKCNMADELIKVSKRWFKVYDLFDENVSHCESHGVRDKGTVTSHQYLILK